MPKTHENCSEIRIRKEAYQFSSAHMTVFLNGTKEAIHGHSFLPELRVQLKSIAFQDFVSFSEFKSAMKVVSARWDEKLLLAKNNPHFSIQEHDEHGIQFTLCKKQYRIPSDEVVLLEVDNITCETLAYEYHRQLRNQLARTVLEAIESFSVFITETPGQGAQYGGRS